jgi:hypothetical protein
MSEEMNLLVFKIRFFFFDSIHVFYFTNSLNIDIEGGV